MENMIKYFITLFYYILLLLCVFALLASHWNLCNRKKWPEFCYKTKNDIRTQVLAEYVDGV